MLSSHTCSSEKQCYSRIFYYEMCVPCWNVCFYFGPRDSIHCQFTQQHFNSPGCQLMKTQRIAAMETRKQTGSETEDSTQLKKTEKYKNLHDQRHMKTWINQPISLFTLCVLNLATRVEPEKQGQHKTIQYFEFGLQYPFQPLAGNITCCKL